jgi:hypothetical protein
MSDDPTPQWQHDNEEDAAREQRFIDVFGMTEDEMAEQVHRAVWDIADKMPPTSLCTCESMGGRYGAHRSACPWQQAFEAQLAAEEEGS